MELLAFRSGHAYRVVHLHHHAHFPAEDDLEGAAAGMSWQQALLGGVTLQFRLWRFALRAAGARRTVVRAEIAMAVLLAGGCLALWPLTRLPALYLGLMVAGSWIYPFMTAYLVHDVEGESELTRTRFVSRTRALVLLAFEHLYHLEHHLYPQVPHHNWPRLAQRLDPYFESKGLTAVKLLF